MKFAKAGIFALADLPLSMEKEASKIVQHAMAVLVVLTTDSLKSVSQLQVVLQAARHHVPMVPIATPNFRFPDAGMYRGMKQTSSGEAVAEVLQQFFKTIALALATHASDTVLSVQCEDILTRLASQRPKSPSSGPQLDSNLSSIDLDGGVRSMNAAQGLDEDISAVVIRSKA